MEVEDEAAANAKASVDAGYAARERLLKRRRSFRQRCVMCAIAPMVILTSISCLVRHQAQEKGTQAQVKVQIKCRH